MSVKKGDLVLFKEEARAHVPESISSEDIMVVVTMLLVVAVELVVMVVTKFQMDLATIGML